MATKKITPTGLISSIMAVGGIIGLAFTIDGRYMTQDAHASDIQSIVKSQQQERVSTDLALIELEIEYLDDKINEAQARHIDESEIRDAKKKLKYLEDKKLILEKYQMDLDKAGG